MGKCGLPVIIADSNAKACATDIYTGVRMKLYRLKEYVLGEPQVHPALEVYASDLHKAITWRSGI